MSNSIDRRRFGRVCAGLAAVAVSGVGRVAQAADLPHVDEAGPQAQALGYVSDASKADKVKFVGPTKTAPPTGAVRVIAGGCGAAQPVSTNERSSIPT